MKCAPVRLLLYASLLLSTVLLVSCDRPGSSGTNWSFTLEQVNGNATLEIPHG